MSLFYFLKGFFLIIFFRVVKKKIQHAVAQNFGVDASKIYLTKPTFFSKMNSKPAKTVHDEYWLPHVDRVIIICQS